MKLLSVTRGPVLLIAALLMTSGILSAIDRYNDPAGVNSRIGQLQKSSPALVKVHKLAQTPGGREMLMMEIGTSGDAVPAVLVAANMSGTTPLATEAALSLASRLVKDESLRDGHTWYILPVGNPDAYARYFAKPLYSDTGNGTPFNDDTDELTDEDGYNDLDGNGIITQMTVPGYPLRANRALCGKPMRQKARKVFISFILKALMTTEMENTMKILPEARMSMPISRTCLKTSDAAAVFLPVPTLSQKR
jgi:hypothetical protein